MRIIRSIIDSLAQPVDAGVPAAIRILPIAFADEIPLQVPTENRRRQPMPTSVPQILQAILHDAFVDGCVVEAGGAV